MERRIFTTAIPGCQNFLADYGNVYQGLLHIVVRHYRQFQKAIPALSTVLRRLPLELSQAFEAASFARSEDAKDRLTEVAAILKGEKASASIKVLMEAEDLVAAYFDAILKQSCYQKNNTTKSGKLQQIFEVKMGVADAELVLGVSKDANPQIITPYFQKPKKTTPIAVTTSPPVVKPTVSGWAKVTRRKRNVY
uniref:BRO1 domain-containing protein n=1 Tax=Panagrellus redivivus TaxID=6233 RepID=A0A7E4V6P6_PANRE